MQTLLLHPLPSFWKHSTLNLLVSTLRVSVLLPPSHPHSSGWLQDPNPQVSCPRLWPSLPPLAAAIRRKHCRDSLEGRGNTNSPAPGSLIPSSRVPVHLFPATLSPPRIFSCPGGPTDSGASARAVSKLSIPSALWDAPASPPPIPHPFCPHKPALRRQPGCQPQEGAGPGKQKGRGGGLGRSTGRGERGRTGGRYRGHFFKC